MKSLRIYIAGPYSGSNSEQIDRNVFNAIDAGIEMFRRGHYPYVPHLTHLIKSRAEETGNRLSWKDFIRWDMPWLEMCDAILYLGRSIGADLELQEAKRLGKLIFYSIEEIPDLRGVEERDE